jgi:DNA-binding NarL/FixJ family response regulator
MNSEAHRISSYPSHIPDAPIRVAVVDHSGPFQDSLVTVLKGTSRFLCVGVSTDAGEAIRKIPSQRPDVVLVDLQLPKLSGIGCIRRLKEQHPHLQCLALTNSEDPDEIFGAIRAGASGCVLKRTQYVRMLEAIEEVHQGGAPMAPQIARRVLESLRAPRGQSDGEPLTRREEEVLRLAKRGLRYREIADTMGIRYDTVRTHFNNIYKKLRVHSRMEAVMKYSSGGPLSARAYSAEP